MDAQTDRQLLQRLRGGLVELSLLVGVYAAYSLSRLAADDSFAPARERAGRLLRAEQLSGLDLEHRLNDWFATVPAVGMAGSYFYATTHYLVTAAVLVWLWRRGPAAYRPARRALVAATLIALALYLLLPTAPPRLMPEYVDVLKQYAAQGWWGSEASAPRGLGGYTNQLAAFPSMHAGWALWVAWVLQRTTRNRLVHVVAWAYAVLASVVIIGTGNHWVVDALAGWAVVLAAIAVTARRPAVSDVPGLLPRERELVDRIAA